MDMQWVCRYKIIMESSSDHLMRDDWVYIEISDFWLQTFWETLEETCEINESFPSV